MKRPIFFDLASLTKPLTLATVYHKYPQYFDEQLLRILQHRAGFTAGGRITVSNWRNYINAFSISSKDQETIYSDYSALRTMLEIEKASDKNLYELCTYFWDREMVSWLDLPLNARSPLYGQRRNKVISGQVHDDNAFYLKEKVSHAGLFASVKGLCRSLINLDKEVNLIQQMNSGFDKKQHQRFLYGWDTVTNPESSLAGQGCSLKTFGHLGFTGTSIWIDVEKKRGSVILTNATQNYWYDRAGLRELRRALGKMIWS